MSTTTTIAELDAWAEACGVPTLDVYEGVGVDVYDELSTAYDLTTPVQLSAQSRGPVLELCCGAGRVGLSLLQMGVDYVGVDLSAPMLERFRSHAQAVGLDVGGRLLEGDAADPAVLGDHVFGLALVPAFSLVLFDRAQRQVLLSTLRSRIAEGGLLACEVYRPDYYSEVYGTGAGTTMWTPRPDGEYLVTFAELRDGREDLRFLCQPAGGDPVVLRTGKCVLTSDTVVDELAACGYEVVERRLSLHPLAEWVLARPSDGHLQTTVPTSGGGR